MAWQSDMAWEGFASFSWKDEGSDSRLLVQMLRRTRSLTKKHNSTASSSPTPALPVQHLEQGEPPSKHPKPLPGGSTTLPSRTWHKAFLNPTGSYPLTGAAAPQLAPWGWERGMGRVPWSSTLQLCGEGAWELGLMKIYGFATPLHGEHPSLPSYFEIALSSSQPKVTCKYQLFTHNTQIRQHGCTCL